jgi:hypothetical protein
MRATAVSMVLGLLADTHHRDGQEEEDRVFPGHLCLRQAPEELVAPVLAHLQHPGQLIRPQY